MIQSKYLQTTKVIKNVPGKQKSMVWVLQVLQAAVQLHFLEISAFSTLIQRRTGASEKISCWSTLNWRRPIFQRSEYFRRGSALTSNFTTTYWRFSAFIRSNNIGSDSRQKISGAKTFYQHGLKLIQRLRKSAVVHMLLTFKRKNRR